MRNGRATFTFTVRKPEFQGQVVEVKQPISLRDYNNLLSHRSGLVPVLDPDKVTINVMIFICRLLI